MTLGKLPKASTVVTNGIGTDKSSLVKILVKELFQTLPNILLQPVPITLFFWVTDYLFRLKNLLYLELLN